MALSLPNMPWTGAAVKYHYDPVFAPAQFEAASLATFPALRYRACS
jgi:hypothetical protein